MKYISAKIRDLLSLLRLRNAPTAIAATAAAALLAREAAPQITSRSNFFFVVFGSVLLYSAGMVLNDLADIQRDRTLHPDRPLPSGRISAGTALFLAASLLLGGLLLCSFAGFLPVAIGGFIALGILMYDFEATTSAFWGPVLMGILRAANFLLGLSVVGTAMFTWSTYMALPLFTGFHIFLITSISILEETPHARDELTMYAGIDAGLLAFLVFYLLLVKEGPIQVPYFSLSVLPLAIYLLQFGLAIRSARRNPVPERIGAIVGTGVQGMILIESTMVCFLVGPIQGGTLLLLFLPIFLGRWLGSEG